jgi:hypothetical protein
MAEKIVIEAEVKSNIGEVSKDASSAASEFKVMGVSLNGVKKGFASAAVTAKGMFGSIKAGLISTGIGAFVVLIGSLISYFTNTKRGAEMLQRAMAGLGAVVSVVTDLFSSVGETMVSAFEDPKQAVADLWEFIKDNLMNRLTGMVDSFKAAGKLIQAAISLDWEGVKEGAEDYGKALIQVGTGMDVEQQKAFIKGIKDIGTEMNNEAAIAIALTQALQNLTDSQRKLNVETAQRRADIEELKLIAEDVTKTEKERLAAAEKAFKIENDLLENRIANAEEAVRIQKEQNELSESMDEDLDALAQKEIELANIRGESVTKQIELNNKINAIKQTTIDKNNVIKEQNEAEIAQTQTTLERLEDLRQENDNARELQQLIRKQEREIEAASEIEDEELKLKEIGNLRDIHLEEYLALMDKQTKIKVTANKVILKDDKAKLAAEIAMANLGLQTIADAAGEGTAIAKAAAIAQATISGVQGVQNAFTSANANIGATAGTFGAYPITMAALAGTFAAMNIAKIASGGKPGAGGGGGGGGVAAATPAPQMMSGAFDISGGVAPEPLEAYVLTDSMTNSQNQLANIRRRATI